METIENLKAQGVALGYEGDALRAFIKDQQDRLRDERKVQREANAQEREVLEAAAARELKEREFAEATAEAKAAHESEIQKMQLQQGIEKQKKHIFEMERLAAEQNVKPAMQQKEDKSYVTPKTPKNPLGLKAMLQLRNGRKRIGLLVRAQLSKVRHLMYMH